MTKKQTKAQEADMQDPWRGPLDRARQKAAQEQGPAPVKPAPLKAPQQTPQEQAVLPGVPFTPKGTAPMGNELAKTPLFAPIARGRRKIHDKSRLPSPEGIDLWYFGKQLDIGDQDTYLTALFMAKGQPADKPIIINRADFLKHMGRKSDGRTYKWLEQSFDRISTGRLYYDTPEERGSTPLIGPLRYNKETEEYYFIIPSDSLRTFGVQEFGYVEMERRWMIGKDLGKWLQCYMVSQNKGEHRISVENLKAWSGSEGRTRRFLGTLKSALAELVQVGVIRSWEFYEEDRKVKWIR